MSRLKSDLGEGEHDEGKVEMEQARHDAGEDTRGKHRCVTGTGTAEREKGGRLKPWGKARY